MLQDNNYPGDQKSVASCGNTTFHAGDSLRLTFAFVIGFDSIHPGIAAGVSQLLTNVDVIKALYNTNDLAPCGWVSGTEETPSHAPKVEVYPNPTSGWVQIAYTGTIQDMKLFTLNGQQLTVPKMRHALNLSGLSKGMYLLKVTTETHQEVIKILKTN